MTTGKSLVPKALAIAAWSGLVWMSGVVPVTGGLEQGVDYLLRSQKPGGSWGGHAALVPRDTATALEALRRSGSIGVEFEHGRAFLAGAFLGNHDFLSRVSLVESLAGGDDGLAFLWSVRRPISYDPSDSNYPEGGWGIAEGFQTDTLDTALVLQAFAAGGFANGITAKNETLGLSQEKTYSVATPPSATRLMVYFPALTFSGGSGNLDVWLVGPGGRFPTSGWYLIPGPGYAVIWDSTDSPPFAPGSIEVHVRNDAASTGQAAFDIEISFVAAGIDSRDLFEPIDYLRAAQNTGEGWGAMKGAPADLFITLQALITLQNFHRACGTSTETATGIAWLKTQANGDGGYGTGPGSTAFETALAYIVLATDNPASTEALQAKQWLDTHQLSNGSWADDPYQTALALKALPWGDPDSDSDLVHDPYDNCSSAENPDQRDTDGDGSGDICDLDDDNDGITDVGTGGGPPSDTPFMALDITTMTATLPAQPANAFFNFIVFDATSNNLGWWNATGKSWIDSGTAPYRKQMAFYVDVNNCLCIDMNDGDTLSPVTDHGTLAIYLPDKAVGWRGWLYVADDGSTYYDSSLTSLAKAAPHPGTAGDNCRLNWNPEQYDRDTDGTGDACDGDDGEVNLLWFLRDRKSFGWLAEEGALGYNIYRDLLTALSSTHYGTCWASSVHRDADLDDHPDATDSDRPAPGSGYFYLVTAEMGFGEGSLGRNSSGVERLNAHPCP